VLAAGVGGPVTGHGAMLGIVDDPFENWQQAQSETTRETIRQWYKTTFRTRIWEAGAIVVTMTRWHEEDLGGLLLTEEGDLWTMLRLPAIAETQEERDDANKFLGLPIGEKDPLDRQPGEALCPRRFSIEALYQLRTAVGSAAWAAEYQGVPRPLEGNRFKRSWFKIVDVLPVSGKHIRYWDKAATEGGRGARTAGVLMCMGVDGFWYIEDCISGRWSIGERDRIMKAVAERDATKYGNTVRIWHEQEPGSGGKESAAATTGMLAGYPVYSEPVTGSKDVRLEPFAAQAEAGNVRLVKGDWNSAYIEELCAIPNGRTRDQADATSGAFNKLARMKFSKPGVARYA